MFSNILIVLGNVETVVMPPVFTIIDFAKTFSQLKIKESFHIERVNPELNKQVEHVNLLLHYKMYLFQLSGFSLLFFSRFLLVSLNEFAFYVNLNL